MAIVKLNLSGHDNQQLADMGFTCHKLHVDLADPELCHKVAQFLANMIGSSDTVQIALPGLGALAVIVSVAIHGLCGQHPTIIPMLRQQDGTFAPGTGIDLQGFRNDIVRANLRDGVVVL